jgi:photosystem II stability/assembly factor-like uncharacterized protein
MPRRFEVFIAITFLAASACTSSPITPLPTGLPLAQPTVTKDATNAGRVQSISVSPTDRNRALIAMEFGGLWQTFGGGNWFRVHTLPAVFVSDVEYGADGRTVVATVQRDNKTVNGGGIYVSRTSGDFWARPATGVVPGGRSSAHSVSHAPDERGLWYVGTDYGVATSRDDGETWSHVPLGRVQSVLAMPSGTALAMTSSAVQRSNDRGATWRIVISDDFSSESFSEPPRGGNKMDRSPYAPWAFIFKNYKYDGVPPRKGSGALWFYELDTDTKTLIPLPQGRWRGPFVRVSKDLKFGGQHITIWVGEGWDGYYVTREDAASIRAIRSDAEWDDWVSFIAPAGIHADLGDLGLDGDLQPVFVGSDGGIFKPRPGAPGKWMSAAVPGSGMNSLQISDLAGTNVGQSDGTIKTSLYFTTQDNKIWASPDGGQTWPARDSQEGFRLEGRPYAGLGEPVTVAYTRIGSGYSMRFAGNALSNQRNVSNLDMNGQALDGHLDAEDRPLDKLEGPFFVYQQAGPGVESSWVRLRWRKDVPGREVYVSMNSGKNWRKIADFNLDPKGEIKVASGLFGWLPVSTTGSRIGLVPLTPIHNYLNGTTQTYDDSDVVLLPNNGSLGIRATMFDWHAVFAVHPLDWKFLIAPDIVANDVKVSRDGGASWKTDAALSKQVLRGGALKLWDGSAYRMQVTAIAFESPPPSGVRYGNRIFVGTRDAGIICSADGALSWRTVKDSDKIKYITGFHFRPDGGVYVSSYGHGIWYVKPAQGCPEAYSFPWDQMPLPPVGGTTVGDVGAIARDTGMPAPPRGIADPDSPKLFLTGSVQGTGVAVVASDHFLNISGRGFPAGEAVALTSRDGEFLKETVKIDKNGQFSLSVRLPEGLPFGAFSIEAVVKGAASPITADFVKALTDESDEEKEPDKEFRD